MKRDFRRHQAEKDKTHPAQKEDTSKEQKENVHYFQKRTRNVRKPKKTKNWRRKGKFAFPCHANQIGIEGKKNTFIIRAVIIT